MNIFSKPIAATLLLCTSLAYGGALSVSNSKGFDTNQLVDKNGVLLTDLDPLIVAIGTFASEPSTAIPGSATTLDSGAYATLLAEFTSYGSSVGLLSTAGPADRRGCFAFQDEQTITGQPLEGKPVYVLVTRGVDLASATEVAIIKTNATFEAGDDDYPVPKLVGVGIGLGSTVIAGADTLYAIAASGADPSTQFAYSLSAVTPSPEIVVEQPAGINQADGTGAVSFGTVDVGSSSQRIFTIGNTGGGNLDLTGTPFVLIDGLHAAEFTVTVDPNTPIIPTGSTTFTVTFNPAAAGLRSAQLHIANNDSNENPFDLDLSGTGVGSPPTDLALSPDSLSENLIAGTTVGCLSASDIDPGDTFTYTLVAGTGDADNGLFTISSDQLLTATEFDHEMQASASIRVRVVDSFGLSYEEALTVTITDDRNEDFDMDGLTEAEEEDTHGTSDTNPDSDGDGFEDGFEVEYGFDPGSNLDGTGDRDGDGSADWLEVRLGTDADVAGPGLDFAVYPNGLNEPTVRIGPGGTLLGIFVERSTTLAAPWMEVAKYPVGLPLGQTIEWTDGTAPANGAFYRVGAYPLAVPVTAADGFTWVTVGDPSNTADPATALGTVVAEFQISVYEVTIVQWVEFLNAKETSQPLNPIDWLHLPQMETDQNVAGIAQSGAPGSYSYAAIGSPERPVTFVSWLDAARYVNWLHNGMGSGDTESGVYDMSLSPELITRAPGATYFLPTRDEWYKAAYYDPSKGGSNYWLYPTRSDVLPNNNLSTGANFASFRGGDYTLTPGNNTYSGTTQYLTHVGSFVGSASHYGTFDQGGSVWEWTESLSATNRERRGGTWGGSVVFQQSNSSDATTPDTENSGLGFRVAKPAAP